MNEAIQFLKDFQNERNTQPNDGNANPVFWTLMDYKWEVTAEDYEDRISLYDVNCGEPITVDSYVEDITDGERTSDFTSEQIDELSDIHQFESSYDLMEWIKENDENEYYLIHEKEVAFIVPNIMFLTKAEAKRHIELNHYHYTSKVHTYAMTVWRAPVTEKLLSILETFNWDSIEINEEEAGSK